MLHLYFPFFSLFRCRCTLQLCRSFVAFLSLSAVFGSQEARGNDAVNWVNGTEEFTVLSKASSWLQPRQRPTDWAKRILLRAHELYSSPGLTENQQVWVFEDAWRHLVASYELDPLNTDLFTEILRGYTSRFINQAEQLLARVCHHYQKFQGSKKKVRVLKVQLDQLKQAMGIEAWIQYWAHYDAVPSFLPGSLLSKKEKELVQAQKATGHPPMSGLLSPAHVFLPFSDLIAYWDALPFLTDEDLASLIRVSEEGYALADEDNVQRDDNANGKFYQWQQDQYRADEKRLGYWDGFETVPAFHKMKRLMRAGLVEYFEKRGLSKEDANVKSKGLLVIWCSVMSDDASHALHDHGDAIAAGVFYIRVSPGHQRISFGDPRSGVGDSDVPPPPFHRGFGIQPNHGSMVIFPGYLQHSVDHLESSQRSEHSETRISFPFNLQGEWEDTGYLAFHQEPSNKQTVPKQLTDIEVKFEAERALLKDRASHLEKELIREKSRADALAAALAQKDAEQLQCVRR